MNDHNATELIRHLLDPSAFAHAAGDLQLIETHISWVVLAGEFAYKIKKPVDLGFLDFSTLELRRHFCAEELRLNRQFAPSLYLAVVPIGGTSESPRIGAEPAIEWAVCMHRFPTDAGLDRLVAANAVEPAELRGFGETLARAHAAAAIARDHTFGSFESIVTPALDNFASLEHDASSLAELDERLATLRGWTVRTGETLRPVFAARVAAGRIRECHGDLHLRNIVRLDSGLVPFDCLEFDPALRWIDVFSDVGFLVMALWRANRFGLACEFLNRYLEVSGDYDGLEVLPYYSVYRALVRAKTNAIRYAQLGDAKDGRDVVDYVDLAARIAGRAFRPVLVVCHGLSGSGKTWLSDGLIAELPALRVRSDVVRKQLHGLGELERSESGVDSGIYAADASRRTYERLAAIATSALHAGLNVIVDATCLARADRQRFARVAESSGAGCVLLHCDADRATLEARVRERRSAGGDASEADLAVLTAQYEKLEPLDAAELDRCVVVDTTAEPDFAAVACAIRARDMR